MNEENSKLPSTKEDKDVSHVTCTACGGTLLKKNFPRHQRLYCHDGSEKKRSSSASSTMCRATRLDDDLYDMSARLIEDDRQSVISVDSNSGRSVKSAKEPSEKRFAGLTRTEYNDAHAAAMAMIRAQHEDYDVVHLCDYLERNFNHVPEQARPYLAIGVAVGAQHASHLHFVAEANRSSDDSSAKKIAESSVRALAAWILGLSVQPLSQDHQSRSQRRVLGSAVVTRESLKISAPTHTEANQAAWMSMKPVAVGNPQSDFQTSPSAIPSATIETIHHMPVVSDPTAEPKECQSQEVELRNEEIVELVLNDDVDVNEFISLLDKEITSSGGNPPIELPSTVVNSGAVNLPAVVISTANKEVADLHAQFQAEDQSDCSSVARRDDSSTLIIHIETTEFDREESMVTLSTNAGCADKTEAASHKDKQDGDNENKDKKLEAKENKNKKEEDKENKSKKLTAEGHKDKKGEDKRQREKKEEDTRHQDKKGGNKEHEDERGGSKGLQERRDSTHFTKHRLPSVVSRQSYQSVIPPIYSGGNRGGWSRSFKRTWNSDNVRSRERSSSNSRAHNSPDHKRRRNASKDRTAGTSRGTPERREGSSISNSREGDTFVLSAEQYAMFCRLKAEAAGKK